MTKIESQSVFSFLFGCAQESKVVLIQAKHTRTASSHLGSRVDSALQQLTEQEMLIDAANSQIPPEVANKDTFRTVLLQRPSRK